MTEDYKYGKIVAADFAFRFFISDKYCLVFMVSFFFLAKLNHIKDMIQFFLS